MTTHLLNYDENEILNKILEVQILVRN